jgi:hypothetical protein
MFGRSTTLPNNFFNCNLQNRFVTRKSPEALQQPRSPVTQAIPVNMKKKAKAMMQQRLK